jgi:hypothetical protein
MIDDYLIAFVSGFKHRKHRAGRSRQTKSGAEANRNRSTTQYGRVNRSVQLFRIDRSGHSASLLREIHRFVVVILVSARN